MLIGVVMEPVPDLDALTWLFEDAPDGRNDWRSDWPYTEVVFRTTRDGRTVSVALDVAYEDVRVVISSDSTTEVDLSLHDVLSVAADTLHGVETLVVSFRPSTRMLPLRLDLKPVVALRWSMPFPGERT